MENMLSAAELKGLKEIICSLSPEDVMFLSETVSCRKVVAENLEEAIEIILRYSASAQELLRRKRIHAIHIFNYLHTNDVHIDVKSEKRILINKALEFWNSGSQLVPYTEDNSSDYEDEILEIEECQAVTLPTIMPDPVLSQMPVLFIEWFYRLLNNSTGDFSSPQDGQFGPQHFWEDSSVCLRLSNQDNPIVHSGSRPVAECLSDLVTKAHLKFEPESKAVKAESEAHGLVKVFASGVVYNQNLHPCGLFDQGFGLIKEFGSESNWKIKFTELQLVSKDREKSLQFGNPQQSLCLGQPVY